MPSNNASCIGFFFLLFLTESNVLSFTISPQWQCVPLVKSKYISRVALLQSGDPNEETAELVDLKAKITEYLKVRQDRGADEEAKKEVGKVIGGTKGNYVLDYVSGAPNKQIVREEAPNVFDYDELIKYGFSDLVQPIMDAGGRMRVYELMEMTPPPMSESLKPKKYKNKPLIDPEDADEARYTGLKMGQVLDDDLLGRELEEIKRKEKEGIPLRKKLKEEMYVQPFADKRNVGPKMTPDWTPEMLDEEGRKRGRAQSWAKKQRAGELRSDPYEDLRIEGGLRTYCMVAALLVSLGFGRSTPTALSSILDNVDAVVSVVQIPALALVVAAIGSSAVSASLLAPERKRNAFVWGVKGFLGGPLAVLELRELEELQVRGEE